ncbi:MAG: pyridoxal-dependent decarboxylase [Desulfurococcaceae archaeon]|nr:pyridoxal-dependent decarboxylase [Desulfurococcaceae archaeon]
MRESKYLRLFLSPDGSNFDSFVEVLRNCMAHLKEWWAVPSPIPEDVDLFREGSRLPEAGEPPEQVLADLVVRLKRCRRLNDRNLSFMRPSPNVYSVVVLCMASLQNPNNAGRVRWVGGKHAAAFQYEVTPNIEEESIKMLADIVGFDRSRAGGNIVSGGTVAILTALLVARDKSLKGVAREGLFGRKSVKVLTSRASHFAIRKAMRILGLGENNLIEVPVATDEQLKEFVKSRTPLPLKPSESEYEERLEELGKRGEAVIAVIPTVGTTAARTIEPVEPLVKLRNRYGFQLVVDAAFGGFARLLDEPAKKMRGIEESDAVIIDPHKWGYVPYPCGAVLFRNSEDLKLLEYEVPYYEPAPTVEGSRPGSSAAALWVALKTLGKEGYREIIGRCIENAMYLEKRLREEGHYPVHEVDLNTVNFDVKCDTCNRRAQNKLNERVVEEINKRRRFLIGFIRELPGIKIDGEPLSTIHVEFMNPYTSEELIEEFIDELKHAYRNAI